MGRLFLIFLVLIGASAFAKELPDWGYEVICENMMEEGFRPEGETLSDCVAGLKKPSEGPTASLDLEQCIYVSPENPQWNFSSECAVSSFTNTGSTESIYLTREGQKIKMTDNSSSGQPLKFTINGQMATKEDDNCYVVAATKEKFCFYSLK